MASEGKEPVLHFSIKSDISLTTEDAYLIRKYADKILGAVLGFIFWTTLVGTSTFQSLLMKKREWLSSSSGKNDRCSFDLEHRDLTASTDERKSVIS